MRHCVASSAWLLLSEDIPNSNTYTCPLSRHHFRVSYDALTDPTGYYKISRLPPGEYTISVRMVGMNLPTEDVFIEDENDSIMLDFILHPVRLPGPPMIDSLITSEIISTEWFLPYGPQRWPFPASENIDWFSHPGELRLEQAESTLEELNSDFRLLCDLDLDNDGTIDMMAITVEDDHMTAVNDVVSDSTWSFTGNKINFLYSWPSDPDNFWVQFGYYTRSVESIHEIDVPSDIARLFILCLRSTMGISIAYYSESVSGHYSPGEYHMAIPKTGEVTPITSIDVTDYNGDGIPEIIAAKRDRDLVQVYHFLFSDAVYSDTLSPVTDFLGDQNVYPGILEYRRWDIELVTSDINSPDQVLAGDFNNDGLDDVLVSSQDDDALTCFFRDTQSQSGKTWGFWRRFTVEGSSFCPTTVSIADLNGDGHLDIVAAGDSIGYWLNTGSTHGSWKRGFINSPYYSANRIACADVDQDGDIDLIASGLCGLSWFRNNGREPSQWNEVPVDRVMMGMYGSLEFIDMNSDGNQNIVSIVDGKLKWWDSHFDSEGRFVSEVFEFAEVITEAEIDWVSTSTDVLNAANLTSVSFRVRSSDNEWEMENSDWSEEIHTPGDLMPYLNGSTEYIQYEAILRTEYPDASPILQEVIIGYSYLDSVPDPDVIWIP